MREARSAEVRWFVPFYEVLLSISLYNLSKTRKRKYFSLFFLEELLHLDRTLLSVAGLVVDL
jgi:hypothetical protein